MLDAEVLRQWVASEAEVTTIWSHPNAPRPELPYATIEITQAEMVGMGEEGPLQNNGEAERYQEYTVTFSINIYETYTADPRLAFDRAFKLNNSLRLTKVTFPLQNAGFAYRTTQLLTATPAMVDNKFEPRATFDVDFGVRISTLDELGWVESVILNGENIHAIISS